MVGLAHHPCFGYGTRTKFQLEILTINVISGIAYFREIILDIFPDSKVHGANMGPIWGRQDPGGPHEPCYLSSSQNIRETTPMESHKIVSFYNNMICCTDRLIRSFLVHQNSSPWYHGFWCPGDRASAGMVLTLCIWREIEMIHVCRMRRQAIIWTSAEILLIGPSGTNFSEFLIEIHTFPFKENAFENIICKMASISSRP